MLFLFITFLSYCQSELYLHRTFYYKGDTLQYRVLFPKDYDHKKTYPLVLFLHGSGECGSDNELQLIHGSKVFSNDSARKNFPAIVIFPQCPTNDSWVNFEYISQAKFNFIVEKQPSKPLLLAKKMVEMYKRNEAVDSKRIYVLGLSLGGMATYDLICRYPKTFAAAIPICGAVDVERLKKCRNMPIRIYHGSKDNAVSPEYARNAYSKLKEMGSKQIDYIEFSDIEHDSWNPAFADPNFLIWLFEKSR